jgi:ribosomal protein S18 acetylase RimI-like enzyme
VDQYPSHLHIDLLEKAQGRGIGKAMMLIVLETLREQGSKGVHLGMGAQNSRAFAFYTKLGFTLLDKNDDEWTMGLNL